MDTRGWCWRRKSVSLGYCCHGSECIHPDYILSHFAKPDHLRWYVIQFAKPSFSCHLVSCAANLHVRMCIVSISLRLNSFILRWLSFALRFDSMVCNMSYPRRTFFTAHVLYALNQAVDIADVFGFLISFA